MSLPHRISLQQFTFGAIAPIQCLTWRLAAEKTMMHEQELGQLGCYMDFALLDAQTGKWAVHSGQAFGPLSP
jgi:hypothetical protein